MDIEKEFRVFVYQNNITAVSSQHIYKVNTWLNSMTDTNIIDIIQDLRQFFILNIRSKMSYAESYVMDIVLLDSGQFYFIEPNTFGSAYSSGSALFQWLLDDEMLHTSTNIEFRYTAL